MSEAPDTPEDPDWQGHGIAFKVATGGAGLVAEPDEGSGEMPMTFIPAEEAALELAEIRKLIDGILKRSPKSYVAEFLAYELAGPMEAAMKRLPTKPVKKGAARAPK